MCGVRSLLVESFLVRKELAMKRINAVFFVALLLSLFACAQQAPVSAPAVAAQSVVLLKIDGKIAAAISITQAEWAKLPRSTVAFKGHAAEASQYEGVPLKALLEKAGVLQADKPLRSAGLMQYVIVTGSDGYRVLFSIGELDDATGATGNVLLADKVNGKPLDAKAAPLQLIVPTDKRPARCVRMVTTITIGTAE
jgi:DMSO/TMAO reductase YedYZ molybdopterin-dependent catalytic subunit